MSRFRWLRLAIAVLLSVFFWINPLPSAQAQVEPIPIERRNILLTHPEQINIINRLVFDPSRVSQRLRVLRVINAFDEKEQESQPLNRRTAYATTFNYSRGVAERFLVDSGTGEVLREEVLPGRPQPSVEERQEAARTIQASSELRPMLESGAFLEGGFAVAGPLGASPTNRYVQMQILSVDRSTMLRVVTVDLTTDTIVATSNLP